MTHTAGHFYEVENTPFCILGCLHSNKSDFVAFGCLYFLLPFYVAFHASIAGFPLGSTVQSETKGIWMWCVPHPSKPNHTLVLLDTEGLGDVEKVSQKVTDKVF